LWKWHMVRFSRFSILQWFWIIWLFNWCHNREDDAT
jgi:hypothetical protein